MSHEDLVLEALPEFLRDIEIVGPASAEVQKYKRLHAASPAFSACSDVPVTAESTPVLLATQVVREAYQSNNFALIKQLETDAQNDVQPIYTNISSKGADAWTKVRSGGKEFYMAWSGTASVWAYTDSITPVTANDGSGTTYQAVVQFGTYTATGKIAGIHTYNLSLPTLVVESAIAYIVARAVSGIIAEGLGFLVARFSLFLVQAAVEIGLEGFAFSVSTAAIGAVASCLAFAVVFIGLVYLWNWLNRKYTIRLQVFNWDSNSDWKVPAQYMSNAKIPGGTSDVNFTIPKLVAPGDIVTPPGFDPVVALDSVCSYAVIIWENDNTFMEGCSMALQVTRGSSQDGFMWAFDCPRWSDNQQAASNGIQDPKSYRNNAPWNPNPKSFSITATPANVPVTVAVDALSGASDNLYNSIININKAA